MTAQHNYANHDLARIVGRTEKENANENQYRVAGGRNEVDQPEHEARAFVWRAAGHRFLVGPERTGNGHGGARRAAKPTRFALQRLHLQTLARLPMHAASD